MARIRTIKPSFWSSEQVVRCSRDARLLFIGLWNHADDEGRFELRPMQIRIQVFPGDHDVDDAAVERMLAELEAVQLLIRYEANGMVLAQITGWHHQKIDRAAKSRLPPVDAHSPMPRREVAERSSGKEGWREGGKEGMYGGRSETECAREGQMIAAGASAAAVLGPGPGLGQIEDPDADLMADAHACVKAYNGTLPMLQLATVPSKWSPERWRRFKVLRENYSMGSVEEWVKYFRLVLDCPFLLGEGDGTRGFRAELTWLLDLDKARGIAEGKYDGHK